MAKATAHQPPCSAALPVPLCHLPPPTLTRPLLIWRDPPCCVHAISGFLRCGPPHSPCSVFASAPPAASPTSPDKKAKRHEVKSDPTPFGLRGSVAQLLDTGQEGCVWPPQVT